jgi:hypothetical protein
VPTYTVRGAVPTKTGLGQSGNMQDVALALTGPDGVELTASWFAKMGETLPQPGSQVEGSIEQSQYGPKWKPVRQGGGGGGGRGWQPEPPEKRRSIAMQHCQKCAVELLAVGAQHGPYTPPERISELAEHVRVVADALFKQVLGAESGPAETTMQAPPVQQPPQPVYGEPPR